MLLRPGLVYFQEMNEKRNALVGFGGGRIGGLTAMPTIWCVIKNPARPCLSVPALVAGSALGILAFRNVQEATFRRAILGILLASGLLLVV